MGAVTAPPASPLCETSTLSSRRWEVIDRREMREVAVSTFSVRTADLQGARCKVHEVRNCCHLVPLSVFRDLFAQGRG